ncbi:MAG: DNA starvation/stationary phase protection protein Dps [Ktedonobacteraceae bacterium]
MSERNSPMPRKNNTLPEEQQTRRIEMLNRRLADTIDLQLQSRQAYWNVKGPNFISLRELFDQVAKGVEEYANLIAGRIVQLGGTAEGSAQAVAGRSSLDGYSLATASGSGHINALATTLTNFSRHARYASEQATELQDTDTADILTEIARGSDKWLWFVETSQQAGN